MQYFGNVYRPPSEARSLILQVTLGCSNNSCRFCPMYKGESFQVRREEEVFSDIEELAAGRPWFSRVFLADGDSLVLSTNRLLRLLRKLKASFPNLERISAYTTAKDLLRKSVADLRQLKAEGLDMVYVGLESGSDRILQEVDKRITVEEMKEGCLRAREGGLRTSVTLIAGLGGREGWRENARESAKLISEIQPDFVAYLTLNLTPGTPLYEDAQRGKFSMPGPEEIAWELREFLLHVDSPGSIFRANHASNYVNLKGTLNEDREVMVREIEEALREGNFKPEEYRLL